MTTETTNTAPTTTPDSTSTPSAEGNQDQPTTSTPEPRKFKVKIDGTEKEYDEDTLLTEFQKREAAHKRFEQASAERKQAEAIYNLLKTNPFEAMAKLGLNPREVTETWLAEQLSLEMMTPEERELKDLRREKEERKRQEEEYRKQREEQELQELTSKHAQDYENQFIDALGKSSLPANATSVRRVAEVMYQAALQGVEIPVTKAIKIVEQDVAEWRKSHLSSLDSDRLYETLGEEGVRKLRERDIKNIKNPTPRQPVQPSQKPQEKKHQPRSSDEYFENIRRNK